MSYPKCPSCGYMTDRAAGPCSACSNDLVDRANMGADTPSLGELPDLRVELARQRERANEAQAHVSGLQEQITRRYGLHRDLATALGVEGLDGDAQVEAAIKAAGRLRAQMDCLVDAYNAAREAIVVATSKGHAKSAMLMSETSAMRQVKLSDCFANMQVALDKFAALTPKEAPHD